jgi:glioma pathogenesis-related protein 2
MIKKISIFTALLLTLSAFADGTTSFQKSLLTRHNELRAKHDAPPLKWSAAVEKVAQDWAKTIAAADNMRHRQPNKYGENIFWISGMEATGVMVSDSWYDEIKDYHFDRPGFSMDTGHFTQVVWKDTKEIGCGSAKAANGGTYVVCNYNPPGNYSGRFPVNVVKPK